MIQLRALTKSYGAQRVDALDLVVLAGEFVSIMGPSGFGKASATMWS